MTHPLFPGVLHAGLYKLTASLSLFIHFLVWPCHQKYFPERDEMTMDDDLGLVSVCVFLACVMCAFVTFSMSVHIFVCVRVRNCVNICCLCGCACMPLSGWMCVRATACVYVFVCV